MWTWPPASPTERIGSVGWIAWVKRSEVRGKVQIVSNMGKSCEGWWFSFQAVARKFCGEVWLNANLISAIFSSTTHTWALLLHQKLEYALLTSIRVCCRPKGGTATFTFMLIYVREACHFNVSEAKRLEFCDTD